MHRSLRLAAAVPALLAAGFLVGCGSPEAPAASAPAAAPAAAPAPTADAASARAWVEALYARFTADPDFNPIVSREGVWDPAMLALMARADQAQEATGDAVFDFEPLCQCQDNTGLIARAGEARATGPDAAVVPVDLSYPAGAAGKVEIKLARVNGEWRVRDIAGKDVPSYAAHLEAALAAN